jgi:hypothetical protein
MVKYKKVRDQRNRKAKLVRRLKPIKSCGVCSVIFTPSQVNKGMKICYKTHCNYVDSLVQADVWKTKADRLRVVLERDRGSIGHVRFDQEEEEEEEEEEETKVEAPMEKQTISLSSCDVKCQFHGCTKMMPSGTVEYMEWLLTSPNQCVTPHIVMGVDGTAVGRCDICRGQGIANYYYCDRHVDKHEQHTTPDIGENSAQFYESNNPAPTPQRIEMPKPDLSYLASAPGSPVNSILPDLTSFTLNEMEMSGLDFIIDKEELLFDDSARDFDSSFGLGIGGGLKEIPFAFEESRLG